MTVTEQELEKVLDIVSEYIEGYLADHIVSEMMDLIEYYLRNKLKIPKGDDMYA